MTLPLWLRRLPHNLATIRARVGVELYLRQWRFHILRIDSKFDPGDANYAFHFSYWTLTCHLGPVLLVLLELLDAG